jgi:hypothetical protein
VRTQRIPSRPHVQGQSAPIRLRHNARNLTDAGGLVLLRRVWDALGTGKWLNDRSREMGGRYRPSLMVELWVALLLYGGACMDDLRLLRARSVQQIFGWTDIPDPTTYGRWLRRAGSNLTPVLDQLLWHLLRCRWATVGIPRRVTLVLDSTVAVRYGKKQAGAEVGYNPKKRGRPSHHPLVAFLAETADCVGIRWRPGSAGAATDAHEWLEVLVDRLREAGVADITVRLDKGFFSKAMVETLQKLGVQFFLKVPDHNWVRRELGIWRYSKKSPSETREIWINSGELYGARLLSTEWRELAAPDPDQPELALSCWKVTKRAHVLTNVPGVRPLAAWKNYNAGAVVEHRIEELVQLGAGRTAIDDIGGNALLWAMTGVAYQLLHIVRTTALQGCWRRAQPKRLRLWFFRLPARITTHARKLYLQFMGNEPVRPRLLLALRRLGELCLPPPQSA